MNDSAAALVAHARTSVCGSAGDGNGSVTEPVVVALGLARAELTRRLQALKSDDWPRPTPCTEWNTRELVSHVVGVQFRVARLLRGGSREDYVATREDDWLASDHLAAWDAAVSEFDSALRTLGSLDSTVDYRVPISARDAVRLAAFDTTVHAWDLSRAIGFDEVLGEEIAGFALEAFQALVQGSALAALFVPPKGEPPTDASPQERLLLMAGR